MTKIFLRLLRPGMGWVLLLTPISMAAVIIVLTTDRAAMPIAIVVYLLSAYTLTALIVGFPQFKVDLQTFINKDKRIAKAKAFLYENKYTGLYLTNIPIRVKVSLYISLFINLSYAILKMSTGIIYASFWFGSEAVFYLILGLVRFFILRNLRKNSGLRHEYQVYRFCGFLLFILNAALTGIVYQTIHQGGGNEFPGLLIYIVATYTFIFLVTSIIHLIKYRKLNSPIISAVKVINLTTALVAIYSLQIAMFASFGENKNMELIMNSIFGGLLCVSIFGMAVFMVVRGYKKRKELKP
jgi:hypothetical protein